MNKQPTSLCVNARRCGLVALATLALACTDHVRPVDEPIVDATTDATIDELVPELPAETRDDHDVELPDPCGPSPDTGGEFVLGTRGYELWARFERGCVVYDAGLRTHSAMERLRYSLSLCNRCDERMELGRWQWDKAELFFNVWTVGLTIVQYDSAGTQFLTCEMPESISLMWDFFVEWVTLEPATTLNITETGNIIGVGSYNLRPPDGFAADGLLRIDFLLPRLFPASLPASERIPPRSYMVVCELAGRDPWCCPPYRTEAWLSLDDLGPWSADELLIGTVENVPILPEALCRLRREPDCGAP
jgi:hypothetical protein